MYIKVNILYFL